MRRQQYLSCKIKDSFYEIVWSVSEIPVSKSVLENHMITYELYYREQNDSIQEWRRYIFFRNCLFKRTQDGARIVCHISGGHCLSNTGLITWSPAWSWSRKMCIRPWEASYSWSFWALELRHSKWSLGQRWPFLNKRRIIRTWTMNTFNIRLVWRSLSEICSDVLTLLLEIFATPIIRAFRDLKKIAKI